MFKKVAVLLGMYLVTVDLLKLCSLDIEGSYRPKKNNLITNYKYNSDHSELDTKSETALATLSKNITTGICLLVARYTTVHF